MCNYCTRTKKNLEVGRKGQGVLYMSMVRVQSFLGVGQQVCTPSVLTWANLHQDPSSHLVSQCKIPCSHARYVLLNLRILLVKTPLQPASSQNAARNTMRASRFCLVQICLTLTEPPHHNLCFLQLPKWI